MSKEKDNNYLDGEFRSFMESDVQVPGKLSNRVISQIHRQLNPSFGQAFLSLAIVHLFSGTFTLFVCPQFGVGPIGGWLNLMEYVMPAGTIACALFCGTLYMGVTAFAASLILSPEILRVLEKMCYQQFSLLAALSMGVLMLLAAGQHSFHGPDLLFTFFWLLGGILVSQWILHVSQPGRHPVGRSA